MHKYLHHIGDFMRDTVHLNILEECFYRRALDFYYLNEKPLPKETQVVFRRLRANNPEEQQAVINVLNDFFNEQEDGFHNNRCDAEIAEYVKNVHKNRENGKKGGRPPKNQEQSKPKDNPEKTQSVSVGSENVTQNNLNQEPLTINHKPVNSKNTKSDEEDLIDQVFTYWQKVFNKNRTKLDAKRKSKIKARLADGRTLIEIQTAIDNCSKSEFHTTNGHIDIELICRDDSKFESFLSRSNKPIQPQNNNHNGYIDFSTIGNKPETEILVHGVHDEPSNDYPF